MPHMPLVQIHGVDDVRIDQVPTPTAGPDDIVIDVASCGICGSDLGYIAMGGLTPPGQPMPLGHELSGVVTAVGDQVQHLKTGQRVVVNPTANGTDIGNGGPEGGFAPQLLVTGVSKYPDAISVLPDSLSFEEGALVEPLAVATHAINQAALSPGQTALVFGAGPIGLCATMVLKYRGVKKIVVADQSEQRLSLARELGASATCNVLEEDLEAILKGQHGEAQHYGAAVAGTDVYIEATGVGPVLEQVIALAKPGAGIVVVGVHKAAIQLNPLDLLIKELRLVGSMAYPQEFPEVIEMLSSGKVNTAPLISHRYELDDFMEALATARDTSRAAKVMVSMNPSRS
jgi:2-desacetyl-2-hydroxyethyl bacteriochlorophyllide A dehydrogenase